MGSSQLHKRSKISFWHKRCRLPVIICANPQVLETRNDFRLPGCSKRESEAASARIKSYNNKNSHNHFFEYNLALDYHTDAESAELINIKGKAR
jgi:hypothetical protein